MASSTVCPRASHKNRICRARWRDLRRDGIRQSAEGSQQVGHFDGGHGGIETLVTALGAGPVDGLLQGVRGEHAERYRDPRLIGGVGHALGGFGRYIIEM